MRILAYEHVTGGGMLDEPGIAALAPEGETMLRALAGDLASIGGVEVAVMRDARLPADLPAKAHVARAAGEFWNVFRQAVREADAVWPIAPEQDGVLARITREVLAAGRTLLGSRPDAIEVTASKRKTAALLSRAGIPVVPAYGDARDVPREATAIVVKPDDGAGCRDTLLFRDRAVLQDWLRENGNPGRIFQPFVRGEARSLSLVCCEGRARLLACNRQKVGVADGVFRFDGVSVNAVPDAQECYAALAGATAHALPGLWGYCGIDFIESDAGPLVVEVNPRLTTSYAGLRDALGINPARLVLGLPRSLDRFDLPARGSRTIEIEVTHAA
ncbi:MAG TPA: ATP-grasp domain-containing protein [Burkholderiales bacterium]|nr:ATP-grasp domain-containing protein [Burkholderiales bacterium]